MAGSSFKMRPTIAGSSPKIVDYILTNVSSSSFTIIGTERFDYWWWWLKLKYGRRLQFYKSMSYDQYLDQINNSDTCVDTSPVIGGTAFVEMYLLGLNPIGVNSGICGYSPIDQVKCGEVVQLNFENSDVNYKKIFFEIQNVHSLLSVEARYLAALEGRYTELPESLTINRNNLDILVREGRPYIGYTEIKNIFRISVLTFRQKLSLVFCNFNLNIVNGFMFLLKSVKSKF